MTISRRDFLRISGMVTASGALGLRSVAGLPAYAQSGSDYKALVCIFLMGGNDGNNMLIPIDNQGYSKYAVTRGSALTLGPSGLLPLSESVALHPSLTNVQSMFQHGKAAVLANVGPLVQPITRAQYLAASAPRPVNLYSHRDQQIGWQTANPAVSASTGWAGCIADQLGSGSGSIPSVISLSGASVFQNGRQSAGIAIPLTSDFSVPCHETASGGCSARSSAAQQLLTTDTGMTLVQADQAIASDMYTYFAQLQQASGVTAKVKTAFPSTSVASQLKQVANVMASRQSLGTNRQIFYVTHGGFDTHSSQKDAQATLLIQLDQALAAFQTAMAELSLTDNVTSFTMSDFSRTLVPNSAGGTDHAWGGHHFIVGGAVKGGQVYGTMPDLTLGGPDDAEAVGRWIPTTSASQYTATLANWFGVSWADMPQVVANIGNFSKKSIGFLG